jgi:hypothetical protein
LVKDSDYIDSFYNNESHIPKENSNGDYSYRTNRKAKNEIFNEYEFEHGRKALGKLIVEGMQTTGGTDIDWLIEHRGSFVILEFKKFHQDKISIGLGQMIAYEKLYENLNQNGKKCYIYLIGTDDIDFDKPEFPMWWFEMKEWVNRIVIHKEVTFDDNGRRKTRYYFERDNLAFVTLQNLQTVLEKHWKEFENLPSR